MSQKGLTKIEHIDESLFDCEFFLDGQRISQVIVNLLSNALKFTTQGFIKLAVTQVKRHPVKKLVKRHKVVLQSRQPEVQEQHRVLTNQQVNSFLN